MSNPNPSTTSFTVPVSATLTYEALEKAGACSEWLEKFQERFGESVELTEQLAVALAKEDWPVDFLAYLIPKHRRAEITGAPPCFWLDLEQRICNCTVERARQWARLFIDESYYPTAAKLTLAALRERGACEHWVDEFANRFAGSVMVTESLCERLAAENPPWPVSFLARFLPCQFEDWAYDGDVDCPAKYDMKAKCICHEGRVSRFARAYIYATKGLPYERLVESVRRDRAVAAAEQGSAEPNNLPERPSRVGAGVPSESRSGESAGQVESDASGDIETIAFGSQQYVGGGESGIAGSVGGCPEDQLRDGSSASDITSQGADSTACFGTGDSSATDRGAASTGEAACVSYGNDFQTSGSDNSSASGSSSFGSDSSFSVQDPFS